LFNNTTQKKVKPEEELIKYSKGILERPCSQSSKLKNKRTKKVRLANKTYDVHERTWEYGEGDGNEKRERYKHS